MRLALPLGAVTGTLVLLAAATLRITTAVSRLVVASRANRKARIPVRVR
jgi:hypothetical protein